MYMCGLPCRSSGGVEIEKAKKSSDRYQAPPNISMVMTGCHALLKFTGFEKELPHSLIESGDCHMTISYIVHECDVEFFSFI